MKNREPPFAPNNHRTLPQEPKAPSVRQQQHQLWRLQAEYPFEAHTAPPSSPEHPTACFDTSETSRMPMLMQDSPPPMHNESDKPYTTLTYLMPNYGNRLERAHQEGHP